MRLERITVLRQRREGGRVPLLRAAELAAAQLRTSARTESAGDRDRHHAVRVVDRRTQRVRPRRATRQEPTAGDVRTNAPVSASRSPSTSPTTAATGRARSATAPPRSRCGRWRRRRSMPSHSRAPWRATSDVQHRVRRAEDPGEHRQRDPAGRSHWRAPTSRRTAGLHLEDAQLRRAGLDYHDLAKVTVHPSLESLWAAVLPAHVYAFTTRGRAELRGRPLRTR